jgi:hypothetical protein
MQSAVKAVNSGLNALGSKAKTALNKLSQAFSDAESKAISAGTRVGQGFTNGVVVGLNAAPGMANASVAAILAALNSGRSGASTAGTFISQGFTQGIQSRAGSALSKARTMVSSVTSALNAGRGKARSAGANISKGFAQGMQSQLGAIRSAAAQMAAAADKALRAKAKIHSPSDLTDDAGGDFGQGWINGISGKAKAARKAIADLIHIPQVATPDLAMSYSGELSSDYEYNSNARYIISVPLNIDGREFAKAEAEYMQDELDKKQMRANRKYGKV